MTDAANYSLLKLAAWKSVYTFLRDCRVKSSQGGIKFCIVDRCKVSELLTQWLRVQGRKCNNCKYRKCTGRIRWKCEEKLIMERI